MLQRPTWDIVSSLCSGWAMLDPLTTLFEPLHAPPPSRDYNKICPEYLGGTGKEVLGRDLSLLKQKRHPLAGFGQGV